MSMSDPNWLEQYPTPAEMCEQLGHEWLDAGGGLEICAVCGADRWADQGRDDDNT